MLSGYTGFSSTAVQPSKERCGSFFFVKEALGDKRTGAYDMLKQIIKKAKDAGTLSSDDAQAVLSFNAIAEGTIAHELAHQFSSDEGHYADSDGTGIPDETSDFHTVQFDYTRKTQPPGYLGQDYWTGIQYGHGNAKHIKQADGSFKDGTGFLLSILVNKDSMLLQPD